MHLEVDAVDIHARICIEKPFYSIDVIFRYKFNKLRLNRLQCREINNFSALCVVIIVVKLETESYEL